MIVYLNHGQYDEEQAYISGEREFELFVYKVKDFILALVLKIQNGFPIVSDKKVSSFNITQ